MTWFEAREVDFFSFVVPSDFWACIVVCWTSVAGNRCAEDSYLTFCVDLWLGIANEERKQHRKDLARFWRALIFFGLVYLAGRQRPRSFFFRWIQPSVGLVSRLLLGPTMTITMGTHYLHHGAAHNPASCWEWRPVSRSDLPCCPWSSCAYPCH